jgi:murein DD-endopeptidase MepM/ murein hydrolase activator NlpD
VVKVFLRRFACLLGALLLAACAAPPPIVPPTLTPITLPTLEPTASPTPDPNATPLPNRLPFGVTENQLPYETQTGDTLIAIASHFNTTPEEVWALNPTLSPTSTLAAGQRLTIPAYWFPLGGSPYKIIPDAGFVYGPDVSDFDIDAYVNGQPGYLRSSPQFVAGAQRSGGQAVLYVAQQYSVNPRLLLALMEWRSGALSNPDAPPEVRSQPLGVIPGVRGLYQQLAYAAEQMSLGYYGWRTGQLTTLHLRDDTTSRPDMYQNAGTVAVQYFFAQLFDYRDFLDATGPDGFGATYIRLWGKPFDRPLRDLEVIPADFAQPDWGLPFLSGDIWSFTGGPHPVWGDWLPWAALDFAPAGVKGCASTSKMVAAAAPGVVVRAADNMVVLDLDGDGRETTGWVLFHLHIADDGMIAAGTRVEAGDPLGHPSCEGGRATGTHVHLARKFNGEWIPADGLLPGLAPFELGGWVAARGAEPYQGRMMRLGAWVEACTCSTALNTVYWFK